VKLLLDENLSPRLVGVLSDLYPGSAHVHQCGLGSADDAAIWDYARRNSFTIESKDSDFEQRSVLSGAPPKIIMASCEQFYERGSRKTLARCLPGGDTVHPGR